uniref:ATP-dependent DNA helicase n=1 Tax=Bracon brevicornis TaxID=1563983 RepID=A0A6V7JG82_9HYME
MGTRDSRNLQDTDVFIWYEAPMAPRYALEVMDRTLRDIMNNNMPFGGKIVILGGDFRQFLRVNVGGTRSGTVNLSIKFSSSWNNFKIIYLTENMRTLPEENEFSEFLLDVGNGTLNDDEVNINLPETYITYGDLDIAQDMYGKLIRQRKFQE